MKKRTSDAGRGLAEIGEFGLIERLRRLVGPASDERLIVGIGDDAAVWRTDDRALIATTDTMVAGVHFLPGVVPWKAVGWKALAANISDIAAMGGHPSFALVTLCVPPSADVREIEDVYRGMRSLAKIYGVTVAGGDIVRARQFAITIALMGEASVDSDGQPRLLRRDRARPGDAIVVTGPLGGSAGGLEVLRGRAKRLGRRVARQLEVRHLRPWPRMDAGEAAVEAGIECGIDISDGLLQDLGHVCRASGVDADIHLSTLPVEPGLIDAFGEQRAREMALTGGEDYELLLTGRDRLDLMHVSLLRRLGGVESMWQVGRMTGAGTGRVRVIGADGRPLRVGTGGWDHLRRLR